MRIRAVAVALVLATPAYVVAVGTLTVSPGGTPEVGSAFSVIVRGPPADAPVHVTLSPLATDAWNASASWDEPHVHGPRPGWNAVHVEALERPYVSGSHLEGRGFRNAYARPPIGANGSWLVPVLLPWAGSWALTVVAGPRSWLVELDMPADREESLVRPPRLDASGNAVLVAREPPILTSVPAQRVVVTVLYADGRGNWMAPGDHVQVTLAGARPSDSRWLFDGAIARTGADSFAGDLTVPEGLIDLKVNVSDAGRSIGSFTLTARVRPAATGDVVVAEHAGGAHVAVLPVTAPGRHLLVAHAPGWHGESVVDARAPEAPWVLVSPARFPSAGEVSAKVTLRAPDGALLPPPGSFVTGTLARVGGGGTEPVTLRREGDGYRLAATLSEGEYRLVVRTGEWTDEASFVVGAPPEVGGDAPGASGGGEPGASGGFRPWAWAAGAVAFAALAGLAVGLYRSRRLGGRP